MDIKKEIETLKKKLCCKTTKFFDTFGNFPITGKVNTLYVDKETGDLYIWNGVNYIIGGGISTEPPYKVYTALIQQSGTNAPTATILENTISGTPIWSYEGVGEYHLTITGAFTENKTWGIFQTPSFNGSGINSGGFLRIDNDTMLLYTFVQLDTDSDFAHVEIRVYP